MSTFRFNDQMPVQFQDNLPEKADVVVIGGGVIGVTSAWFLAQQGLSVVVCEKGRIAGEQSSRNWGWVRSTGRDADEVPIAMAATELWQEFQETLGDGIGFSRRGVIALADSDKELADYEQWLDVAKTYGLDTRILSSTEVDSLVDGAAGKWKGGLYTPSDGRAEPFTAVPSIAHQAHKRGVKIRENCAVRTIEQMAGRVHAVCTEAGRIEVDQVLVAAGGWSSLFLSNLGVRLPQLVVKGTVARTEAVEKIVFGGAAGLGDVFIRRRQDGGYTVASGMTEHYIGSNSFRFLFNFIPATGSASDIRVRVGNDATQPRFPKKTWTENDVSPFERERVLNPEPSKAALDLMRKNLARRAPELADVPFVETWAGMIDATPDVVPVMDEVNAVPGLFVATGFSGHGFGIGPGAGKVMADLMTQKAPDFDLQRFRFSRFSDGSKMRPGPAI